MRCLGVDKMIQAASKWPENKIPYSPIGTNSDSTATMKKLIVLLL
jgi:hypothetical protein